MAIDPIFERVFKRLYGKPCWGVKNTIGTALTFEFGEPHLEIHEPMAASPKLSRRVREHRERRHVFVHGQWHLTIWYCDWEVSQKGKRLGSHWARSNMDRLVRSLDGQKLVQFSISGRGTRCKFEFDLGGVLVTSRPDPGHDHWIVFEPTGRVLTLCGDGKYSYCRKDRPHDDGPWKPVSIR